MSSGSNNKSASAVLEAADQTTDPTGEAAKGMAESPATEQAIVDTHAGGRHETDAGGETTEATLIASDSERAAPYPYVSENIDEHQDAADMLAQQLDQLVHSVSAVEELSRRAREAATNDVALYDALEASQQQ